jgi:hypothetical protein
MSGRCALPWRKASPQNHAARYTVSTGCVPDRIRLAKPWRRRALRGLQQHGGRFGITPAPGPCVNSRNPHDPSPALRALLVDLDEWVENGVPAPASRVPRLADATLVPPDRTSFPAGARRHCRERGQRRGPHQGLGPSQPQGAIEPSENVGALHRCFAGEGAPVRDEKLLAAGDVGLDDTSNDEYIACVISPVSKISRAHETGS